MASHVSSHVPPSGRTVRDGGLGGGPKGEALSLAFGPICCLLALVVPCSGERVGSGGGRPGGVGVRTHGGVGAPPMRPHPWGANQVYRARQSPEGGSACGSLETGYL